MREGVDRIRRERTSPTSPRMVLRKVLVLAEGRQYREAAAVLQKVNANSIALVANELPLDILAEGLPHSAQLLETLFNKLMVANHKTSVNAEQVIWQLVKLFSVHEDPALKTKVSRLTKILLEYQPDFHRLLAQRKKALEQAIQGLGCHGLTPDSSGLTHLHVAIKTELHRHIDAYKSALHRLDELGLAEADSKKPVDASHQRLLSLHYADVQQRLIDNKTLLTILDKPALKQLRPLLETLANRVQSDKEALFCVSQIKRLQNMNEDKPVAALLMSFSRGCGTLLELMQLPESPCNSDGYHSEPENDNSQTGRGHHIGRYATLYNCSRPKTLEALDALPELVHATQLKSKILFSVVVLAFRTCRNLRETKLKETFRNLHVDGRAASTQNLRDGLIRCLGASAENFPLRDVESQVRAMVCGTLVEYKCLDSCTQLRRYIAEVSRAMWHMVNQVPPFELDTDFQTPTKFAPERHQRHSSGDCTSENVASYLWPALLLENSCVFKAIVVTGGT